MKIVLTLPFSLTSKKGHDQTGANSHSLHIILELLHRKEHEFLIITDTEAPIVLSYLDDMPSKEHLHIFPYKGCLQIIENFAPDILFSTDISSELLIQCRHHSSQISAPLVSLVHLLGSLQTIEDFDTLLQHALAQDIVICPSTATQQTALKCQYQLTAGNKQLHYPVIKHGIPLDQFYPVSAKQKAKERQDLGLDEQATILLGVGRINAYTKQDLIALFRQFEQLHNEGLNFLYLHIGHNHDEDYTAFLKHFATKHGFIEKIQFVHEVLPKDISKYYHCADVFISVVDNPAESFGLSVIEAMACGLPLVLNESLLYSKRITDGVEGYYIPCYGSNRALFKAYAEEKKDNKSHSQLLLQSTAIDNKRFRQRLTSLIQDASLRKKMGTAAAKRAKHYALKDSVSAYLDLFESELKKQSPASELDDEHVQSTLFSHIHSVTLEDNMMFQLSSYGRDVLHERKDIDVYQVYLDYFNKLGHFLFHLQKEALSAKHLQTLVELDDCSFHESLLFLLKQDMIEKV